LTSRKVLIVDDEEPARVLIAAILAMQGWEVAQAADGVEALAAALASRFDLIISDVEMPRMTGPALIRALQDANLPVKCLLISGYSREEIQASAGWETSMHLLPKPFRVDQLLNAIEDVLAPGGEGGSEDRPRRRQAASRGETVVHRAD
jgi:two-component system chemotaxis response regulator CheY